MRSSPTVSLLACIAGIYHSDTCVGIETQLFRTGLNIGHIGQFWAYQSVQEKAFFFFFFFFLSFVIFEFL